MKAQHSEEQRQQIVVGVDGSDSSRAALEWAGRQAELTGSTLVAIATWEWPVSYGVPVAWPKDVDLEADARSVLEQNIEKVLGAEPKCTVVERVIEGHPAPVLRDASRHAALVVVGSRGHGEFTGMLIGSVSEFLATHAHCPVVIVRGDDEVPA